MDRFEDLRSFVEVVEAGTVTGAAARMSIATSAVSRRLKDLEARLGVQLLSRTTRQMRATEAGERFYERARAILADLDQAEQEAADRQQALTGPLRISVPVSFGEAQLGPILADFVAEHPGIVLDVDMSDRMVDLVAKGREMAVRIGTLSDSTLIARKIATGRMVVAAAPSFWQRHGHPSVPSDLAGLPGLCYTGTSRVSALSYRGDDGRPASVAIAPRLWSGSGWFLAEASASGLGLTISPSFIAAPLVTAGRLEPVLTDVPWEPVTIYAVYPETRHLSARARALSDFLVTRIGPSPAWEVFLDDHRPVD